MTEGRRGTGDERDARLDRLLDAALRQMTGGDGPADMRRRVLARLDEQPRPVAGRRAMLAAAAVVALAAGTAALFRTPAVHAPEAPIPRREVTPSTLPSRVPAPSIEPALTPTRAVRPTSRWVARRPSPEIAIAEEPGAEGAPMDPVEPIEAAPLGLAPMQTDVLIIVPLRMDPMEIMPLAEPSSE